MPTSPQYRHAVAQAQHISDPMDDPGALAASPSGTPNKSDNREKRTSRACLNCRGRKSACKLPVVNGIATVPCERCRLSGLECVIGSSNRGGRRVRKKHLTQTSQDEQAKRASTASPNGFATGNPMYSQASAYEQAAWPEPSLSQSDGTSRPATAVMTTSPPQGMMIDPMLQASDAQAQASSGESANIAFNDLQNTSDALGILAQIASHGERPSVYDNHYLFSNPQANSLSNYALVRDRKLSGTKVIELLLRYKHNYHAFFPLVPSASLDPANLAQTSQNEPHLLTAMLVIASRDMLDEPLLSVICMAHMKSLVSALAAGGAGDVEAVEALLLLAEWTAYTSRSDPGHVGRGEEDREAWMHVGIALRIAYFLGLDRYAFGRGDDRTDPHWKRKRLAWTACYMSDRGISIRIGRAFWSRGPGPLNTLRKEDFPMLAPVREGDQDFASIFQARLELTMLFSNVHDVLYSNPGQVSMRNHLAASSYVKYIDDFRQAIYAWKSVWDPLECAPPQKSCLKMSYDYLRLYTNAFAFHTTVKRLISEKQTQQNHDGRSATSGQIFVHNIGSIGDARFIYEGLDAAKSILHTMINNVDPETALRYMPLRFYLYSVYSGVFLFRAVSVGIIGPAEIAELRSIIAEVINRLSRAAVGSHHPGGRYSQLLKLLWDKTDRKDAAQNMMASPQSMYTPGGTSHAMNLSGGTRSKLEPSSTTEIMGDFSWTDLDAIGNFAVNGNAGGMTMDFDMFHGFLPADSANLCFDDLGLQGGNMFGNMPF